MRNSPVPVNLYSNSTVGLRCCCSDDVKMHGFSVIIDMRGSTWHSVKPFLRVLQVCGIFSITQHPPFYGHYARQPALTDTPVKNWRILLVQFYCAHALAGGNRSIWIREKTLEFSTVLSTLSPYFFV